MKKFSGKKVSQCRKKLKGWTLWGFSTSIEGEMLKRKTSKIEGGPFGENIFFPEKSHNAEKN